MNINFADYSAVAAHLGAALAAGSAIGLERSYHARPAGFRTHALVCLASSLLMLVTLFQWQWLSGVPSDTVRTDPTRMAQGIMTGIGFLGAGVIFKEGLTVRGLTTAASIWMTAAIGILFGVGFHFPAILATILTLGILSAFRWIETRIPTQSYAHCMLRFDRGEVYREEEVRDLLNRHGFTVHNLSYRLDDGGSSFEYRMVIRTSDQTAACALSSRLLGEKCIRSFRISPTGD